MVDIICVYQQVVVFFVRTDGLVDPQPRGRFLWLQINLKNDKMNKGEKNAKSSEDEK